MTNGQKTLILLSGRHIPRRRIGGGAETEANNKRGAEAVCCRYHLGVEYLDERVQKIVSLMERDYAGQYKTGEIYPGDTAAAVTPAFAEAFREHRAILPADGFYEWSHDGKKTKYLFTLNGRRTLYLCGLYKRIGGEYRFVILTRPANESMAGIHDRMPVIAAADEVRPYLTDYDAARKIVAYADPRLLKEPAES